MTPLEYPFWLPWHISLQRLHTYGPSTQDDHILSRPNIALPARMDAHRERLTHGPLLITDGFGQLEAELGIIIQHLPNISSVLDAT